MKLMIVQETWTSNGEGSIAQIAGFRDITLFYSQPPTRLSTNGINRGLGYLLLPSQQKLVLIYQPRGRKAELA